MIEARREDWLFCACSWASMMSLPFFLFFLVLHLLVGASCQMHFLLLQLEWKWNIVPLFGLSISWSLWSSCFACLSLQCSLVSLMHADLPFHCSLVLFLMCDLRIRCNSQFWGKSSMSTTLPSKIALVGCVSVQGCDSVLFWAC
jgi:hypothetical protein